LTYSILFFSNIISTFGVKNNENVDDRDVDSITQVLKSEKFHDPSGKCLSPAGEYNLRLGIMKEFGLDSK